MTQAERNQQVHDRVIAELRKLTREERRERLVACGILTEEGQLAPEYQPAPDWPESVSEA